MADNQVKAGTICCRDDLVAVLKRQSQRLLDQNMLARSIASTACPA